MSFRLIKPATIDTEEQLSQLHYPMIVMPKFDGIRCGIYAGVCHTNTLKRVPNLFIQSILSSISPYGYYFDGELILDDTKDFHLVQSAVMTRDSRPENFRYVIFDTIVNSNHWNAPYENRLGWLDSFFRMPCSLTAGPYIRPVQRNYVYNVDELLKLESFYVNLGYEGIIIRSPDGPYKFGRCTWNEMNLFKYKRVDDAEAVVLKCLELEHNTNDATVDERGLTKRSSHKDNKVGSGMLGSFWVRGLNGRYEGKEFAVSCGSMTMEERKKFWSNKNFLDKLTVTVDKYTPELNLNLVGRTITYKFAKNRGTNDAPAEPRFKCFRNNGE